MVSDRLILNQPSLYSTQPFVFGGTSRLARSRTCRTGSGIIQIGTKMCTLLTPSLTGVHEPVPSSPLDRASLQIHLTTPTGGRSLLLTRSNVAAVEVLPDCPEPIIFFTEEEQLRVPDLGHFSSRLQKGDNPFIQKFDQVFNQPSRISAKSSHRCILIKSSQELMHKETYNTCPCSVR